VFDGVIGAWGRLWRVEDKISRADEVSLPIMPRKQILYLIGGVATRTRQEDSESGLKPVINILYKQNTLKTTTPIDILTI